VDAELFSADRLVQVLDDYVIPFGANLVLAIGIFVAGRLGARLATRRLGRVLRRVHVEESRVELIGDLVHALLLTIVMIAALERIGVETTAGVAVVGAAGLAIALALQGSLGDFAAGRAHDPARERHARGHHPERRRPGGEHRELVGREHAVHRDRLLGRRRS
jgi:small-conductance mechanosensitive channel